MSRHGLAIAVLALFAALTARVDVGTASQAGDPVIAAAGDIACDPNDPNFKGGNGTTNGCAELRTSNQLKTDSTVDLVLGLGDMQYSCDDLNDYTLSYTPSWGAFNSMMYPVVGNHEYQTGTDPFGATCPATNTTAANYFWYFGANADPNSNGGYFSFDRGSWHIIGLNANCRSIGGCGASSPETKWLSNDLNTTTQACILAYWHQPLWTGLSSNDTSSSTWWNLLYQKHADVVLNGHVHSYQRFPKLNPSGNPDPQGIREVVVGTGGESQQNLSSTASPKADVTFKGFGYLRMVLHPSSYDLSFVKYDGTVIDTFSDTCNSTPTATPTPSPSPTPSATPSPDPSPTLTTVPTPTPTPTPAATPPPTPTPTATPTATPTPIPPLAFVQQTTTAANSVASRALPAITVTSGNTLILALGWTPGAGNPSLSSVADNNGGTWQSTTIQSSGTQARMQIWYSLNHPSGSTIVTATYSGNVSGVAANLSEWSGIATASAFDASAGTTGSSTTPSTSTVTTHNANDLVFGAAVQQGKNTIVSGPTNSFTGLTPAVTSGSSGNSSTQSAYQIESAINSYTTNWTMSGSNAWAGSIVAFHQ
jgi:acid phosphatase type 7